MHSRTDAPGAGEDLQDPYAAGPLRGRILALPPAEKFGAFTRAIVRELDSDEESIDTLLENGATSECGSQEYLPS